MDHLGGEKGAALVVTLGLLFLMTLLGLSAFRWSIDELGMAANQKALVQARYIAESGVALMLQWFQEPETFPEIGVFPNGPSAGGRPSFLKRRQTDAYGAPSFFDNGGKSQFIGTSEAPDFWYQSEPTSGGLTGEATAELGALTELKLFGPTTAGSFCTVEATGTTLSGISQTVSVAMIPSPIPPTTAAVQVGPGSTGPAPILVHWGDVRVMGDADLGDSLSAIPKKDTSAPVNGLPYPSSDRRDAWLYFFVGGSIVNPPTAACPNCTEPFLSVGYGHLHQFQANGNPGFSLDPWNYQALKTFAKTWGAYYSTDLAGFLYRDGLQDPAHQFSPSQVLTSNAVGDNRGFIFIDTIDQNQPGGANLATLNLPIVYLEGIFYIGAHVALRDSGPGRSLQVQSPPDDFSIRQTVILSNIHLNGILSVAGRLTVSDHPMVFGVLIAQQGFAGSSRPEVWYDAALRTGYYPALPTVTMLKGGWYLR